MEVKRGKRCFRIQNSISVQAGLEHGGNKGRYSVGMKTLVQGKLYHSYNISIYSLACYAFFRPLSLLSDPCQLLDMSKLRKWTSHLDHSQAKCSVSILIFLKPSGMEKTRLLTTFCHRNTLQI